MKSNIEPYSLRRHEPAPGSPAARDPQRTDTVRGDEGIGLGRRSGETTCFFAGFRLEADGTLWRGDAVVHLPPKELTALRLLIEYAGQVVSPVQLKNVLWGDVHVTADSVPKCMSSLRARLEPDVCIQTVYKRGYRFMAEIRRDGESPAGAPVRLAIMPFVTGHFVPEHLGSAIAEETTASLSRMPYVAVAVLARDSVFNLARRGLTAQQIGRELKADRVLAGSLQAFSSLYRLRVEMIRVEDGTQIWVEDLLTLRNRTGLLEQELMRLLAYRLGIAGTGDAVISPRRAEGLDISAAAANDIEKKGSIRQAEAYEIYLRGHNEWQTLYRHRMQDGMQCLLRAIELDPSLIPAKVDLANLCVAQALFGFMSPDASAELVHRMAESIPDLTIRADALLPVLGWVNFHFDRNLPAALLAFSYSAHLPHNLSITRTRSMFSLSRHRLAEAIGLLREAIRIDPFSSWLINRLSWALHLDGQASESLAMSRKAIAQFPDSESTSLYGSVILAYNGEAKQAVELARSLEQRAPHFDLAGAAHAYALACAGRTEEARTVLERLQWLGRERYLVRGFSPAAYLALGDHDAALAELRIMDEARCPWFFQMLADPRLKPLHGNSEFERLRAILPAMEAEVEQDLEMGE